MTRRVAARRVCGPEDQLLCGLERPYRRLTSRSRKRTLRTNVLLIRARSNARSSLLRGVNPRGRRSGFSRSIEKLLRYPVIGIDNSFPFSLHAFASGLRSWRERERERGGKEESFAPLQITRRYRAEFLSDSVAISGSVNCVVL